MEKKVCLVISFDRTIDAMAFEDYCIKNNIEGRLIPLPKEISADCGLAWKCDINQVDEMKNSLLILNIEYDDIKEIEI